LLCFEVINIKNKNKRKGKRTTVYIWPENQDFVDDLKEGEGLSHWFNTQVDRAIMFTSKGIQKKQEKLEQDIEHLQYEKTQLRQAEERAKKIEEERKQRMQQIYQQQVVSPF